MEDPAQLSERMNDLARDLRSQESSEQTLEHIVAAAVDLVGPAESAGISLAHRRGEIRTSAATDHVPTRSDELQEEFEEGPCVDAVWETKVVRVPDLANEERWPRWAPQARTELDVGSMLCLQLFTHEDRLGALNLFSGTSHAFAEEDEEEAVAVAAHAAVALAAIESIEHLHQAVDTRTVIGQAVGMTMHRYGLDETQAFSVLRRLSNEQNRKLSLIARELVEDWNQSGRD